MNKIVVTINGRKYFLANREKEVKDALRMLSRSERRYKHFTLYAQRPGYLTNDVIDLLITRNWKSIKVWSEKFQDESQIESLLESFAPSIENLELRNIYTLKKNPGYESIQKLAFKKMKSLTLSNVESSDLMLKSFIDCRCLESLEVEDGSNDVLVDFLSSTPSVKTLQVTESNFTDEFYKKLSRIESLKLKEFKIKTLSSKFLDDQSGLQTFFKAQADNISSLTIDTLLNFDVLQTILQFPNLKTLNFSTKPNYQLIGLTVNRSITDLILNFDCSFEFLLVLKSSMANLQTVYVPKSSFIKFSAQKTNFFNDFKIQEIFTKN